MTAVANLTSDNQENSLLGQVAKMMKSNAIGLNEVSGNLSTVVSADILKWASIGASRLSDVTTLAAICGSNETCDDYDQGLCLDQIEKHEIKVWDVKVQKCLRALMGHTGSVKSICVHPTNHNVIVSGSRDGSFALWDLRCNDSSGQRLCLQLIAMVHEAHISPCQRRGRRRKASSMSITSVLHLKNEVSIATAGAVDSVIKFWDTRSLKSPISQACPHSKGSAEKERKLHGISSLSQDLIGVFISASCMGSRIYLYNVLQLKQGPVKTFSGCRIDSFFVMSSISPDAAHILSGSSDENAYIWQIRKPLADPIILNSHEGEVTAVDWCPSETKPYHCFHFHFYL
ncbi:PREDICTED: denticleless protein homolog [Ipomoea nil]|uniref:denticleless protein homolog n=1 Tax=Ipomoea nil TaxID=35883 RepID=UPI000901FED6|nr:PREDICTED: denticleless protein homolog [Ipomoea nil]